MKMYTLGFLFSNERDYVVLINKLRPDYQVGKLNGIGGRIEEGETPYDCMKREFQEETGVYIEQWKHFCTMTDKKEWQVECFKAFEIREILQECKTMTDESVVCVDIEYQLPHNKIVENTKWLIPMALSESENILVIQS